MIDFSKNKRGYTLVEVIVAVTLITTLVASYVNLFNGMLTSTTYFRNNMTAQMLAANKWKELDLVAYASLAAEAKAVVGTTGLQREVILGTEVDMGGGNKKRDVTINVYKTGNATPLYTAPKTVTSTGTATVAARGKIFYTSSTTWTVPAGVSKVWVTAVGGGSGGRYGYSTGSAAAVVNSNPVTVTPGEVITITVGAGGAARSSGGASSFGTYVVAGGGSFRMTSPYYGLGGIASGSQLVAACATNGLDGVFYPSGNTPPSGSSTM